MSSATYQERGSKVMGSPLMSIKNELLHGAVVRGELPTVRRLLDRHRADINTRNSNGMSCLQLAILNGHTKLAEFLIQKGVDIHIADPEGYTALHDAAVVENFLLVHKLCSKGLSPMLTTNAGELVIDVAGSVQMEKLLCEEMFNAGEVKLARQYYFYLGLDREERQKDPHDGWRGVGSASRVGHTHPPRSHPKHQAGSKSSLHVPSPKSEAKKLAAASSSQVSRNHLTHAARTHPSAPAAATTDANSSEGTPRPRAGSNDLAPSSSSSSPPTTSTELGRLPNYPLDEIGNHRNSNEEAAGSYKGEQEAFQPQTTNSRSDSDEAASSFSSSSSSSSGSSSDLSSLDSPPTVPRSLKLLKQPKGKREFSSLRTSCESTQRNKSSSNLSPKQARESAAIKALHQHSSFQLQIGLSLQSEQFSTLEEDFESEDSFAASKPQDPSSSLLSASASSSLSRQKPSSPALSRSRHCASIQPDWFHLHHPLQNQQSPPQTALKHTSSLKTARKLPRPLRKTVSFADLPMTRSKPMFVGHASTQGSGGQSPTASEKKLSRSPLNHQSLSAATILDRYISNYNPSPRGSKADEGTEETDSMFDAGIRALQMKPRKSSMSMRRHNSESSGLNQQRRRSVTFQPEVLLQEIVTDGDVKAVSEILESGVIEDVNKMSPSGLTALHQSAIDGNLECAKTLVEKGADVNCTDCENWTPLHAAVMNGSLEFVRFLLASGARPNLKNDAGETAYDMAKSGPIRKMLLHAMNGRSPDADEFSDGEYSGEEEEEYSHAESESDDDLEGEGSGLFDASSGEKTSLKERLGLTHTSALNNVSGSSSSVTPSPDLDNVFSSSSGSSSSRHAYQHHQQRREHELTDSTSSYGSMFESEEPGMDNETDTRLHGKAAGTSSSSSPPTSNGKGLTNESDTDKISESGISTMEGSSDCSHRSRVLSSEDEAITLDSDLDPDSLDYQFQEACLFCDVDQVLRLVKHKKEIDVNRLNKASGVTALHHSVLEENFALVQHLVKDFGADLHTRDIDGWTPLHAASAVGSIQIAQFLLDKGAKPSTLNLSCEFPVDVAEDEAMEKLLKNAMLGHSGLKR